ncbi:MAG: histidine kinase [Eubacterium sp.]|nr:histidine kinase [Eubacterium sp.]
MNRIHSMQQRMMIIMVFGIVAWCIVVFMVCSFSYRSSEKNRMENGLRSDITQLTQQLDSDYYSLVKISQQMSVEGNIGSAFSAYLQAQEPYDKIECSNNVTTSINTMIFNYDTGALASYFGEDESEPYPLFSNLPVRSYPVEESFGLLIKSSEIEFHTFHTCLNAISDKMVISLMRRADFGKGKYMIYAETHAGLEKNLDLLSVSRNVNYTLLQLDENRQIVFSGNPDFAAGEYFESEEDGEEDFGKSGSYYYIMKKSDFGFYNVLLADQKSYLKQEHYWLINICLVFCIGIISIILVITLFFYLIYRPIRQLGQDMEDAAQGNLQPVERVFHIDEFDRIFDQFNDMKNKVSRLMEDIRRSEYEKQQLEIEKLYYQINPHFLMNALNSLQWMAVANHQKEIEEYIYQLNFILGYSLGKIYKKSTFETELKSLDMYLELQKKRYDFNVWKDIRMNGWMEYPCARLILQPLAENAICHNMDAFGNLWITMECDGYTARITIKDDGQGIHYLSGEGVLAKQLNKGIGLRYVQMSLQSFYGDRASLKITSETNRGTCVIVEVPIDVNEGEENV